MIQNRSVEINKMIYNTVEKSPTARSMFTDFLDNGILRKDSVTGEFTLPDGSPIGTGGGGISLSQLTTAIASHDSDAASHMLFQYMAGWSYEESTGLLTFTMRDGSSSSINIVFSEVLQGLDIDQDTKEIVITKADGTEVRMSIADMMPVYQGSVGEHVQISINPGNTLSAIILANSITEAQLAPSILEGLADPLTKKEINVTQTLNLRGGNAVPLWDDVTINTAALGQVVDRIDFGGDYTPATRSQFTVSQPSGQSRIILTGETTGKTIEIQRQIADLASLNIIRIIAQGITKIIWIETTGWSGQTDFSIMELIGEPTATVTSVWASFQGVSLNVSWDTAFLANTKLEWITNPDEEGLPAIGYADTFVADEMIVPATGKSFAPTRPENTNNNEFATNFYVDRAVAHTLALIDITANQYNEGTSRHDTWHIHMNGPITQHDADVEIVFRDAPHGFKIAEFRIEGNQVYVNYYHSNGVLEEQIMLTNPSGGLMPEMIAGDFYPLVRKFQSLPVGLRGENRWYIGSYSNPTSFSDPALRSRMWFSTLMLKQDMGTMADLPSELNQASLTLAMADMWQKLNARIDAL